MGEPWKRAFQAEEVASVSTCERGELGVLEEQKAARAAGAEWPREDTVEVKLGSSKGQTIWGS